jgi:uncharacterized protein
LPKTSRAIGKSGDDRNIFIDSSAWIALFSRRDQHHDEADRVFRTIVTERRGMLTTNLVLAEIHRLILYRAGVKAAAAALERIEASPLVEITFVDATHHQSAKDWMIRLREHQISYTDAVSFSVMKSSGCREALSYDRHFRIAGFEVQS